MKKQCFRHGEICFVKIADLPKDLKKETGKVIVKGSHGNSHSFDNGELYLKNVDNFVFGYFVAKNTTLFHLEHGDEREGNKLLLGKLRKNTIGRPKTKQSYKDTGLKSAKIPNGIYELRKQQEFINSELKPVID